MGHAMRRRCGLGLALILSLGASFASAQPSRRPEIWAILVGVNRYDRSMSTTVGPTTARGAKQVLHWLRQAGWDDGRHQLLLTDYGAADPGRPDDPAPNIRPRRQNLDWAFRNWLFSRAKPGDLVVFYYAGRSRAVVKPQGERVNPRVDYYLLPADAAPDSTEKTGWALDRAIDDCAEEAPGRLLAVNVARWPGHPDRSRQGPSSGVDPGWDGLAGPAGAGRGSPRGWRPTGRRVRSRRRTRAVGSPGHSWRDWAGRTTRRSETWQPASRTSSRTRGSCAGISFAGWRTAFAHPVEREVRPRGRGTTSRVGAPGRTCRGTDRHGCTGRWPADHHGQQGLDRPSLVGAGGIATPRLARLFRRGGCDRPGTEPRRSLADHRRRTRADHGLRPGARLRNQADSPTAAQPKDRAARHAPRRIPFRLDR